MRKALAVMLLLVFASGCATKPITVQVPTVDTAAVVRAISESNLPAAEKAASIKEALVAAERMQAAELNREAQRGENVKSVGLQIIQFGMSIAALVYGVSK